MVNRATVERAKALWGDYKRRRKPPAAPKLSAKRRSSDTMHFTKSQQQAIEFGVANLQLIACAGLLVFLIISRGHLEFVFGLVKNQPILAVARHNL
jgi:hypothetical protein